MDQFSASNHAMAVTFDTHGQIRDAQGQAKLNTIRGAIDQIMPIPPARSFDYNFEFGLIKREATNGP